MQTHINKNNDSKSSAVANSMSETQNRNSVSITLPGNDPVSIAQRKSPEQTNNASGQLSGNNVIQRQIEGVVADLPQNILDLATAYNQLGDETTLSTRINQLSGVEHAVYNWLTQNKAPDMNTVPNSALVRNLMDTTKAERHRIITQSVNVSQDHLGVGDIPIAGFNELGADEQLELRSIWRGLIQNTGSIRIVDTEHDTGEEHAGFNMKVLTEFSRLLEGRFGRSMIRDINESAHHIVIEPFHIVNDQHKSFAAGPTAAEHGVDALTKLPGPPDEGDLPHYPETVISDMNEAQRLHLFNQLKRTQAGQLGVKLRDGDASTYYRFGAGSAVRVTMPSDLADGSQRKESRLADATGNELATPVFTTLGHELGHGIHMQRGTLTAQTEIPGFFGGQLNQQAYLGNKEEYTNIEGNENALRAEHGLGSRKGHYNIPYLQKQRMEADVNRWYEWLDQINPKIKNLPLYQTIEQRLMTMGTRVFTEWAEPDTLAALKTDFAAFPNAIRTLQLNYIRDNFATHMDSEYQHLMLGLYRLRFSFNTATDIPMMVDSLDREFKYEKVQAAEAVDRNELPAYLASLPEQRRAYAEVKFSPKIASFAQTIGQENDTPDSVNFETLKSLIRSFETLNWLFPG